MQLRDYQEEFKNKLSAAFLECKRVLGVLPTGGGKTVILSSIVEEVSKRGFNSLVVVHRKELVAQISGTLDKFSIKHGIIMAGEEHRESSVQVCLVDSYIRRNIDFKPDFILFDEAHHVVANNKWGKVAEKHTEAWILGLTATPCRGNKQGLNDCFDILVEGPTVKELTDRGYLVPTRVLAPPAPIDWNNIRIQGGDYSRSDSAREVGKITGDVIEHYIKYVQGRSAVAFCASVRHAKAIAERFSAVGIPASYISGSQAPEEREKAVKNLESGRLKVLASCDVISEGFDIPHIFAALLLRPTKSLSLFLQQVGRALRPSPGKSHAIILDHVGNHLRFGFAEDLREWSLQGSKRSTNTETLPPARRCFKCFMVVAGARATCPFCEEALPKTEREIKEEKKKQLEELKREKKQELKSVRSKEDLEAIARKRGYRPGWVEKQAGMRGLL